MSALRDWFYARTTRERRLLVLTMALGLAVIATSTALAVRDHFRELADRVVAREHELATVRQLASRLRAAGAASDAAPLVSRVEAAATGVVGRERLAAMTPATAGDGRSRVTVRVSDTALPEVVALLHAVESAQPPVVVTRLEIRPRPGDTARFDLTAEVASLENPS